MQEFAPAGESTKVAGGGYFFVRLVVMEGHHQLTQLHNVAHRLRMTTPHKHS